LIRASTSLFRAAEGVDGRVKPGQDETREPISFLLPPQDFPWTALRLRGNDEKRYVSYANFCSEVLAGFA
jgi:hypothetical protein